MNTYINLEQYGWICPKCGASLSPTSNFCPFCIPVNNTVENHMPKPVNDTVETRVSTGTDEYTYEYRYLKGDCRPTVGDPDVEYTYDVVSNITTIRRKVK